MTKIKTLATVAATTLALGGATVATTAQAQTWHRDYNSYSERYDRGVDSRLTPAYIRRLDWKVDNARSHGLISWQQARELHMQLRDAQPMAWRVQNGQARPWEIRRLQNVVDRVDSLTQGYAYNTHRGYWR